MAPTSLTSVLVVAAEPDARPSTRTLQVIVDELRARPNVNVHVWLLRSTPEQTPWEGAVVVDDLRTWAPARALDAVGLKPVAAKLRGLRLRRWNRNVAADVVLLDDGLGDRVLVGLQGDPVIVIRTNATDPAHASWEPAPERTPDLDLGSVHVRDYSVPRRYSDAKARAAVRTACGLPEETPLVVGWGDDGWIDGPDLFIRALWSLEVHHGIVASGLWCGMGSDPHEVARLETEAARCGLEGRFFARPDDGVAQRCCGDAVFLPYRSAGEPTDILAALAAGLTVVTFPSSPVDDPAVRVVAELDVDAAAAELAVALSADRVAASASAEQRLDVGPLVDRLLAASRVGR